MKMLPVRFYHQRARIFAVLLVVSLVVYFLIKYSRAALE
jgi:hypothetical protein